MNASPSLNDGRISDATVLSVDVVEHSRNVHISPLLDIDAALTAVRKMICAQVAQHDGKELSWAGDGGLFVFWHPTRCENAVYAALSVMRLLDIINMEVRSLCALPLRLRLVIHCGKLCYHEDGGSVRGEALNFLAKNERSLGKENGVRITEDVRARLKPPLRDLFPDATSVKVGLTTAGEESTCVYEACDLGGRHVSWEDVTEMTLRIVDQIATDGFNPDIVIGIGRGGAILGGLLAGNLGNVPLRTVDREITVTNVLGRSLKITGFDPEFTAGKTVLVVSGEVIRGQQLSMLLDCIAGTGPVLVRSAAVYCHDRAVCRPDYIGFLTSTPVNLPWRLTPGYVKESSTHFPEI